ncbi:RING finger [Fusarium beomiforme]|uniref:RING finger n=1 Tax=Fusarium beomiforme TaxID=44412 RepID=A0A9P5AJ45_9HYPO|nr:RING finger [Fusarium beomiforme]
MDPMDFMLSSNHHRPSGHYDPVHSASNHWAPHSQSQNSPAYPWPAQTPNLPHLYSNHYALPPTQSSVPDPYGHHTTMLPPMLGVSSPGPYAGSMSGPASPRPNGRAPSYRNSMPVPVASMTSGTGDHSHDTAFANQIPTNRPPDFQPQGLGLGMPPLEASHQEVNSLHRSPYAHVDSNANGLNHSNTGYFPHFLPTPLPPHTLIPTSTRRGHFTAASSSSRPFGNLPSPTKPAHDDNEDDGYHGHHEHALYSSNVSESSPEADDAFVRQMQLVRGSLTTKMVASKATLQSLQSVRLEDIPEADRSCVICYNEYGVETPEGINEVPLRLPKCGHLFGDHCIKKWLEDSDSCPYCRDRLPSEPKAQTNSSAVAFLSLMRNRGANIHPAMAASGPHDEALARAIMATYGAVDTRNNGSPRYSATVPGGRRSPSREGGEHQHRRLRTRYGSSTARDNFASPENRDQAVSTSSQSVTTGPRLSAISRQTEQPLPERQTREWTGAHAQNANEVSTSVQAHNPEPESLTGVAPILLPVLPPYTTQDAESQSSSIRTLRNPLQTQTGAPFEGLGNNETAPDMTYHGSRNW